MPNDRPDENHRTWPGDTKRGEIEVVEERVVWENDVARLYDDRVRVPGDGPRAAPVEKTQFRLGHAPSVADGVVIVPVGEGDEVLLVRQFRHPVRMWIRELPRGGVKAGEAPADAARRELREELGCETRELWSLGRITNDSGQVVGIPYLFVARVVEGGEPARESGETIDSVCRYRFTALLRACERGEIVDSFTLATMLRLAPHFDGDRFAWRADAAPTDPIR
jgi:ADP-ribose pyrophosphatase